MKYITTTLFAVLLFWILPQHSHAQLLEVKQTVYGMDCAPCAYALENRINSMEGVTSASVSLNDGLLTASLFQKNTLTLKQIRKAVEESGFSPKKAEIKVTGTLQKENNRYIVITPSEDKYAIRPSTSDAENRLGNIKAGQTITLSGHVPQKTLQTEYWTLTIDSNEL